MLTPDELKKQSVRKTVQTVIVNLLLAGFFGLIITLVSVAWLTRHDNSFVAAFVNDSGRIVASFFAVSMLLALNFLYSFFYEKKRSGETSKNVMICIIIFITFGVALITSDYMHIFTLPIGICASLVCILAGRRSAMVATLVTMMIMMLHFLVNDSQSTFSVDYAMISLFTNTAVACFTIYVVSRSDSRIKFIVYSLLGSLLVLPFTLVMLFAHGDKIMDILVFLAWQTMSSVLSTVLFMFLLPMFESVFNIADDFRLDEICNLKHPLLRKLAEEASGTFNHSQSVAVLAENCAVAIGENHHLAKAAAYYHDVGKLKSPLYFVENQDNYNPHDELLPEVSVSLITSHAMFGFELCKKHHIPDPVARIALEHHGDSVVGYFYMKAKKISGENLPPDNFRYPGPKPQSKIAAIIMIVDTVEAASRVYMPETHEKLEELIDKFVKEKMDWHQLDECPITLRELTLMKKSIVETLPAIRHGRISYIEPTKPAKKAE